MDFSFYINGLKDALSRRKILIISLFILFLFSIMCGIIIQKPLVMYEYYFSYCDNYVYNVFSENVNIFLVFLGRCGRNIAYLCVICLSATIVFLFPLHIIILFYNGYVLGVQLSILCSSFGIGGFFVALLLILPQGLICGAILIFSAPFSLESGWEVLQTKSVFPVRKFFIWAIFFLILCVLAAFLEFFTVLLIFRPFAWAI
ncbi:MAG: stage II sporulation protein M [Clostridia bacterium]|nr:stage II sporulation protein M [Clostridia bacterium]